MTLDDRMQAAFDDRTHSLETTMTTPTFEPLPTGGTTTMSSFFGTFGPWIAGAVAITALLVGASTLAGDPSGGTNLGPVDQATSTTEPSTERAPSTTESVSPSTTIETPDTLAPTPTVAPTSSTVPTTTAAATTCTATGYTVTVPAGWSHENCVQFSPAAIPAPGPFEFRPEIDLAYSTSLDYATAVAQTNANLTVLSSTTTTVDGLAATIFVIEEEWYDVGQRTVYIVDGGAGVFYASGNELVDSGATFTDRAAHYAATLVELDAMMATVDVAYVAPKAPTTTCIAPTLVNPVNGPSVQADLDGDGQLDTVQMIHHDSGVSLVVDAGPNGVYSGGFVAADAPHVSNDIVVVDLDYNGVSEILASAQSGPAGNTYESFQLSGCDLEPIGGGVPALIQRASVTNTNSFECSFSIHGNVQLDEVASVYNNTTSEFDIEISTYQLTGGAWELLGSTTITDVNPMQLTGPTSCA